MSEEHAERVPSGALARREQERLTRRDVLRGVAVITAGATAFELASGAALAQGATPAAGGVTVDQLMALSATLVGGGNLNADFGPQLLDLFSKDPTRLRGLQELLAAGPSAATPTPSSPAAKQAATDILSYWYLGEFDGKPVPTRQGLYFGLASWQTVPYITIQSVCKGFGYWAKPVPVNLKPA